MQNGLEFMAQTIKVSAGHSNNHLLYKEVRVQVIEVGANTGNDMKGKTKCLLTALLARTMFIIPF